MSSVTRVSNLSNLRSWSSRVVMLFAALVIGLPATAAGPYVAVDLAPPTGGFSFATAVNNRGQVVGRTLQHAFLWEEGVMRDLGTLPGGSYSEANAINDLGQVVGWSTVDDGSCTLFDGCWHAFLWDNGTMMDLGALTDEHSRSFQSYAYSINDRGQIAGISAIGDYPVTEWHAVVWENGTMTDLGKVPGSLNTYANGINNRGEIVGWWDTASTTNPLLWTGSSRIDLPTRAGATYTLPYKINSKGQVTGFDNAEGNYRAILWDQGAIMDLGILPGGVHSFGRDINNRGQVAGESFMADGGYRAFVWQSGHMTDLGTLPGGSESYAGGINDRGDIAGGSNGGGGPLHAVLWIRR